MTIGTKTWLRVIAWIVALFVGPFLIGILSVFLPAAVVVLTVVVIWYRVAKGTFCPLSRMVVASVGAAAASSFLLYAGWTVLPPPPPMVATSGGFVSHELPTHSRWLSGTAQFLSLTASILWFAGVIRMFFIVDRAEKAVLAREAHPELYPMVEPCGSKLKFHVWIIAAVFVLAILLHLATTMLL